MAKVDLLAMVTKKCGIARTVIPGDPLLHGRANKDGKCAGHDAVSGCKTAKDSGAKVKPT